MDSANGDAEEEAMEIEQSVDDQQKKNKNDDDDDGDTDTEVEEARKVDTRPKLFRLSSRISSLKRRGKYLEPREIKAEFDFYADDVVTVRGPEKSFWVCRVLEDVLENDTAINVAWYDCVKTDKEKGKLYKVSFDDVIYKATILMQVRLVEDEETGYYTIPKKYIAETNRLLKKSLQNEGTDMELNESDKGETVSDDDDLLQSRKNVFDFPNSDDEEPTPKRRRTSLRKSQRTTPKSTPKQKAATTSKSKRSQKAVKKISPAKTNIKRGLIPNPEMEFINEDPVFEKKDDDIPLMIEKQGIQAVLLKDYEKLEELLKDTENVYTIHWTRSPHLKHGPLYYAVLNEDRDALKILNNHMERNNVKAKERQITLEKKSTGRYNFHTFGHAVREVTTSRGNKEGNNAFIGNDHQLYFGPPTTSLGKAMKYNLSYDFIKWYFETIRNVNEGEIFNKFLHIAITNGNRELAAEFMKRAVQTDAYGYNFLHAETLANNTEPLTKFKSTSVTKKPYTDKLIYPLHCACINPNEKYAKELFASVPEYNLPDFQQWTPIHYAAVCTGSGPLKFLLSRGIDANTRNKIFSTPLMLAAKCGRDHNIDVLMQQEISVENDEGITINEKAVLINRKNKKTMTALHYAAKYGHVECVKKLIKYGATVDLQAGAGKENFTALCFAVVKGHYDVVKALLNAGASPDKKTRRNKTALMYACMNGHSQIVAHLLRIGVNPNALDTSENSPIHYASAYGWYHCVKLLLEGGADPSKPNNWKTTPLALALAMKHIEIADLLLSADVDVNYPDDEGKTILMSQIESGFTDEAFELVKFLVEKKNADVKKTDIQGWSALHILASGSVYEMRRRDIYDEFTCFQERRLEFVKEYSAIAEKMTELLISAGADINAVSTDGETPLRLAIKQVNYLLVHQLLKHGADPSLGFDKDENGILHLLITSSYLHKEKNLDDVYPDKMLRFSKEATSFVELNQIFVEQSKKAFTILLEDLLEHNCPVDVKNKAGITPLMNIFKEENENGIELLMTRNPSPFLGETENSENFLHFVADNASSVFIPFLNKIAEKHNFTKEFSNATNCDGLTPLHLLISQYNNIKEKEVAEQFVELFQIFCKKFKCDITTSVGKAIRNEKNKNTVFVKCKDKEREEKYRDYKDLGLYSVLHMLMLKRYEPRENPSILDVVLEELGKNNMLLHHRDRYGRTAFHLLLKEYSCDTEVVNYVLERFTKYGYNLNLCSDDIHEDYMAPPVVMIAKRSDSRFSVLKQIKSLVAKGADINLCDGFHGRNALSYTTRFETDNYNLATANYLIKAGIDINKCDKYGRSALHYAVNSNSGDYESLIEMETLLVENNARKDTVDVDKRLPLHYAFHDLEKPDCHKIADPISVVTMLCDVNKNDISSFGNEGSSFDEMLLKYINQVDVSGKSPLHYAAMKGATLSCSHLKKLHANDQLEDNDGNTPLAVALRGQHTGCAMTLLQQGSKADYNIITPIAKNAVKEYEKELERHKWTYGLDPPVYPTPKKDSVFQLTVRKNWQGLAYMMLEIARLPLMDAFKAGVVERKLNLLWTLLKKQRNAKDIKTLDEEKRSLLHILTMHAKSSSCVQVADGETKIIDLQRSSDKEMEDDNGDAEKYVVAKNNIEIAKLLLRANLQVTDVDKENSTPLHYAAANLNFDMMKLLLENSPLLINAIDGNGRTPLANVICACRKKSSMGFRDCVLIKFLVNNDAEVNITFNDNDDNKTTLINELVKLGNIGDFRDHGIKKELKVFKYFFKHKLDIDYVIPGESSALITAILLNDKELVELLVEKKANLKYADKNGKNCIHHCVRTGDYASFENEELLEYLLLQNDSPLNAKTLDGNTPLDIANQMLSGAMANVLIEHDEETSDGSKDFHYKPMENTFKFENSSFNDAELSDIMIDVLNHSQNEIKNEIAKQDITEDDFKVKPDPALDMESNGEVYCNPDTDVPYDVMLSKIDVRWGLYGLNLHYKLQVVYHKGRDLWILFNMWGRPGGDSQHQQTPYNKPEDATNEFKKIFKSKTGNDWDDLENFQRKPKKYALVLNEKNPERVLKHQKGVLKAFNVEENAKSKLPKYMQDFMGRICDSKKILQLGSRYVDKIFMPLDLIKLENIKKAQDILVQIKEIVERPESQNPTNDDDTIDNFSKVADLSNEYYMLVPPASYSYSRIPPLNSKAAVEKEEKNLAILVELNPVVKIMIAAQHMAKKISPLDYCFKTLECRLEMMSPTCEESRLILKYMHNTSANGDRGLFDECKITGIMRFEKETGNYMDHLPEKHLLCHGTSNEHLMGILMQGLKATPVYANHSGQAFGQGIYFSWQVSKALLYSGCGPSTRYILLCEVASKGYIYPLRTEMVNNQVDDIWLKTMSIPDPSETLTMPYGAKIFQGKPIAEEHDRNDKYYRAYNNEVIVRNAEQVKIRYIVEFSN